MESGPGQACGDKSGEDAMAAEQGMNFRRPVCRLRIERRKPRWTRASWTAATVGEAVDETMASCVPEIHRPYYSLNLS